MCHVHFPAGRKKFTYSLKSGILCCFWGWFCVFFFSFLMFHFLPWPMVGSFLFSPPPLLRRLRAVLKCQCAFPEVHMLLKRVPANLPWDKLATQAMALYRSQASPWRPPGAEAQILRSTFTFSAEGIFHTKSHGRWGVGRCPHQTFPYSPGQAGFCWVSNFFFAIREYIAYPNARVHVHRHVRLAALKCGQLHV